MYTLKLNNEIKYFKPGDKVLDLIPIDEQKQYMVCKINESIKELTYPLSEKLNNCEITLLKLDHLESGRAYEATLRYIISMAFANLYPNVKIKFNYNVSRAIFCQILNDDINETISINPSNILLSYNRNNIIKKNIPINRKKLLFLFIAFNSVSLIMVSKLK